VKQQRKLLKTIKNSILNNEEKGKEFSFSTGSTLLDLVVGGGLMEGYPSGKIINVVGDKSTGKTFLACEIVASAAKKYDGKLKWVYVDAESGFTFDTKTLYGVEIMPNDESKRIQSNTIESLYCHVRDFLEGLGQDELGIYIVDSLDGITSTEMEERGQDRYDNYKKGKDYEEGSWQTQKQKFLSQEFFPGLANLIEQKNALLIIISQVRENLDGGIFSKKHKRSGGKAMDFYAHTCLWLSTLSKIEKRKRVVGVVVKAKAEKSKTKRPYRECNFSLIFDYGLDDIGSNVDFLFGLRTDLGKLKEKIAEKIRWDEKDKLTIKSAKQFLIDSDLIKIYQDEVQKNINLEKVHEWIEKDSNRKKIWINKFGAKDTEFNRDSLIAYIEFNGLQKELRERVKQKWEEIEDEISSKREPKYG